MWRGTLHKGMTPTHHLDAQTHPLDAQILTDGMIPVGRVAKHLGVHRSTVYHLIKKGELPTVMVGRVMRIPTRAVKDYTLSRLQWATR